MTERSADHRHFRPSHTSHWFASTQPIRLPALSDFASWIWPDTVRVVPKASNTAEHTQQICSWTRPSLPKRFRCPTFGLVCSWLKSGVVHIPVPVSEKSLHHCLKLNILMRTQVYAPVQYFMGIANYHTWQATCVTSCTFCITGIVALPGVSSYTKFRCWNRYEKGKKKKCFGTSLFKSAVDQCGPAWTQFELKRSGDSKCDLFMCFSPLPSPELHTNQQPSMYKPKALS